MLLLVNKTSFVQYWTQCVQTITSRLIVNESFSVLEKIDSQTACCADGIDSMHIDHGPWTILVIIRYYLLLIKQHPIQPSIIVVKHDDR